MINRREGFYWITSDSFSNAVGIGQWFEKNWYLINEKGPVTEIELKRRGWKAWYLISEDGPPPVTHRPSSTKTSPT
jgi:hypothetical protein